MTDESLTLEVGEYSERFLDGAFQRPHCASHAEIDDVEGVEREIAQIVVNSGGQFFTRKGMNPRFVCSAASAYLGDDHQAVRIRMKSALDDLVGHMRAVKVAGIDVVDAGGNGRAQNGDGGVYITGRSPHLRAGKLHCAVAHAIYGYRGARKCEAAAKLRGFHCLFVL